MSLPTEKTRRLVLIGFLITLPTIFFWMAVFASRYLGFNKMADNFLFYGMGTYIGFTFLLPTLALIVGIITRMRIVEEESKTRIYAEETTNLKLNQRLINWCVLLYSILVLALLID